MKKTNNRHGRTISLCLFVMAVLSLTACTKDKRDNQIDANGTMNIDFGENGMIRNGTEYDIYQIEEGQKGIISICTSKVSGRLDIDVYHADSKNDPDYTGRDLDSASFDVIVEEPGEYEVCVTATEFVGNYEINWRTENNTDK